MTRNFVLCAVVALAGLPSLASNAMAQMSGAKANPGASFLASAATAQDPILAQFYGAGVHEYFSGAYSQAISELTQAVDGGTKDPRVYYFRALAYYRMGDTTQAQADLANGAKLESADVNQYYPVSKSLERVQGSGRLLLERYRLQARAEAYRREEKRNLARYEAQRKAEAEVLRATPPPPAPGEIAPPASTTVGKPAEEKPAAEAPPAAEPSEEKDPFADDADNAAPGEEMPDKDAGMTEESTDAAPEAEAAPEADAGEMSGEDAADDAADESEKDSN
ncbi:MAG TPA: hypothetical protein VMF30_19900 [Pirellulales bacterium]|nr:hypothetical protein [Pirellulales bacterium]